MVDKDGRIFWIVLGALVGGYLGGAYANNTFDISQWKSDFDTYGSILLGAIIGTLTGNSIELGNMTAKVGLSAGGLAIAGIQFSKDGSTPYLGDGPSQPDTGNNYREPSFSSSNDDGGESEYETQGGPKKAQEYLITGAPPEQLWDDNCCWSWPTSGGFRNDNAGYYGAERDKGARMHLGIDMLGYEDAYAPFDNAQVTYLGGKYNIARISKPGPVRWYVEYLYIKPPVGYKLNQNYSFNKCDVIGTIIPARINGYKNTPDHTHVQMKYANAWVDPGPYYKLHTIIKPIRYSPIR